MPLIIPPPHRDEQEKSECLPSPLVVLCSHALVLLYHVSIVIQIVEGSLLPFSRGLVMIHMLVEYYSFRSAGSHVELIPI